MERALGMTAKQTITPWMLRTEGLRVARKEVQALLRSKGIKLHSFSNADLQRMAKGWFELHRQELISDALGSLAWAQLVANIKTFEKKSKGHPVGLSAFHFDLDNRDCRSGCPLHNATPRRGHQCGPKVLPRPITANLASLHRILSWWLGSRSVAGLVSAEAGQLPY